MRNPIIKGHYADPDIACFDGKYSSIPPQTVASVGKAQIFKSSLPLIS